MHLAVLAETKRHEYRVGMTPGCVAIYAEHGHVVTVQAGAGLGAGFSDDDYRAAGARIAADAASAASAAQMIVKVKEPQPAELDLLRPGQVLFTYLHLAALPELAQELARRRIDCIAYETIATADGALPCLQPMSEIAGRLAVQEGAKYLEKPFGGRGVLLGGVPGIRRGKVVILGAGVVGTNAAKIATGIGAEVVVLDVNARRLAYLDDSFGSRLTTLISDPGRVRAALREADVLIGAVLIPGARAPYLVRRADLALMKPGAVIVDVAIDQGGCCETSQPTTHDAPTYLNDGIVHYCVTNMPGVVALSSTEALTSRTRGYGLAIADRGLAGALATDPVLAHGANLIAGHCVHPGVAAACGLPRVALADALAARSAE